MILDAGSVLAGNGTFTGNVLNDGGSIRPGTPAVASILTIDGSYSSNSGDITIKVESASYDQLVITGTADITNTDLILSDNGAIISDGLNLASIISSAGITGSFSSVTNPFSSFNATATPNVNNIDLVFTTIGSVLFVFDNEGAGTDWDDPLNWAGDVLPNPGDDIDLGNFSVTLDTDKTISQLIIGASGSLTLGSSSTLTLGASSSLDGRLLVIEASTLNLAANLTLNNADNRLGNGGSTGIVNGNGNSLLITNGAGLLMQSTATLDNVNVNLQGDMTLLGQTGSLDLVNGTVIDIASTGVFTIQGAQDILNSAGSATINNAGNLVRGTALTTTSMQIDATVNALDGSIFESQANSILYADMNLLGTTTGSTFTGAGLNQVNGVMSYADNAILLGELRLSNATVNGSGLTLIVDPTAILGGQGGTNNTLDNVLLDLQGGFTIYSQTGSLDLVNGTVIDIASTGDITIQGAQDILNSAGSATINNAGNLVRGTALTTTSMQIDATVNALDGSIFESQANTIFYADMNLLGTTTGSTFTGAGFNQVNGTMSYADNAILLGELRLNNATVNGSGLTLIVDPTATLGGQSGTSNTLDNVTLDLQGNLTQFSQTGSIDLINGTVIDIAATGVMTSQGGQDIFNSVGLATINNAGSIIKGTQLNPDNMQIDAAINAFDGSVFDAQGGRIILSALDLQGTNNGVRFTGTVNLSGGALSYVDNAIITGSRLGLTNATTVNGGGLTLMIDNGTVLESANATNIIDSVIFDINGSLEFSYNTNTADITGATTMNVNPGGSLVISGIGPSITSSTTDTTINLNGTMLRTGFGSVTLGAGFTVNAFDGAVFETSGANLLINTLNLDATVAGISFLQSGGFIRLVGPMTYTNNTIIDGTLNTGAGSVIDGAGVNTLILTSTSIFNTTSATTYDGALLDIGGTINVIDASIDLINGSTFTVSNTGIINMANRQILNSAGAGNLVVDGGAIRKTSGTGAARIDAIVTNIGGTFDIQTSSTLSLNGAALSLDTGSLLAGIGTFSGDVLNDGGTVMPGSAAATGTLTINGNYSDTVNAGDVAIKVESAAYDQLVISGTADFSNTTLTLIDNGAIISNGLNLSSIITAGTTPVDFDSVTNPFAGYVATTSVTGNAIDLLFIDILAGFTWTGAGDGVSWNDAANWSLGIPTITDDITIGAFDITITGGADVNTLSLASGGSITLNNGTFTIGSSSSLDGDLVVAGGVLDITGTTLTINKQLDWTAASIIEGGGSGQLVIANGAQFNVSNPVRHTFNNVIVSNDGVLTVDSAGNVFTLDNGSVINNNGLVALQDAAIIDSTAGAGTINNNAGSILRKSGAGAATIDASVNFTNTASTIDVVSGSLGLGGADLTLDSGSLMLGNGTFIGNVINDGGTVMPGSVSATGTLTINGNYSDTVNAGDVAIKIEPASYDQVVITGAADFSNTTLTLIDNGAVITNGLNITDVITAGAAPVNFSNVVNPFTGFNATPNINGTAIDVLFADILAGFSWIGAGDGVSWNDAANWTLGVPTIADDITIGAFDISITGGADVNTLSLASGGSITLSSGTFTIGSSSSLDGDLVVAGGVLDITGTTLTINNQLDWTAASIIEGGGTGNLVIADGAQMNVSNVVTHTFNNVTVSNDGAFIVESAGNVLTLNNGSVFNNSGLIDLQDAAIIDSVAGAGMINNNAGSILRKSGAGAAVIDASVNFSNTAATIDVASGSLGINSGELLLDTGSVLQGSGGYEGSVNNVSGIVRPGAAGSIGGLSISGIYTQGANGTLEIELQGATAGTGYDYLSVGTADLDGNLTISEINGFSAAPQDSFTYLTSEDITGDFAGKRIFPVGFALPQTSTIEQTISFGDGVTVFFDNHTGNSDWNDANNWSAGFVPVAGLDVDTASLVSGGTILISGGTHEINNLFTNSNITNTGGSLVVTGDMIVPQNFVYTQNNTAASAQFSGIFNGELVSGVTINNTRGDIILDGVLNAATVNNGVNGTMTFAAASTAVTGITNDGIMVIDGAVTGNVVNNGTLSGSGTVTGDVTNGGEFNPGNSPGTFTVDGDLNLLDTSVLNIEIAGLQQGLYDELIVTGNVLFDGKLNVIVDNSAGYIGNLQDSFNPITYSTSSGEIDLTTSLGYGYNLMIDQNSLSLITTLVPGLFIPDVQNDVVTLVDTTQTITIIENVDDVEAQLSASEEEDEDEKGSTLVCT